MTMLAEWISALLAAAGLLFLGRLLFGKMLTPVGPLGAPMYIVIRGEGDGAGLEHAVNALAFLREGGSVDCPLFLVDAGLDEQGRKVAQLLLKRWPQICLCAPEELADHLR